VILAEDGNATVTKIVQWIFLRRFFAHRIFPKYFEILLADFKSNETPGFQSYKNIRRSFWFNWNRLDSWPIGSVSSQQKTDHFKTVDHFLLYNKTMFPIWEGNLRLFIRVCSDIWLLQEAFVSRGRYVFQISREYQNHE
jgi:hypothetical protein